ncbi:MAG: DUF3256 family protein [Tannerellaceae bacterium]|nr:DUF3256 family protein [Tannerellaceae bacterium]
MKKYIVVVCFFLLTVGAKAQDMSRYFIDIPDRLLPQLEAEWRKDLIDLYKEGKEARLQNLIGGESSIEKLTDDYLLLRSSSRGTVEMKLLPLVNNTHIICMITTVDGPVADSRIDFFTTEWTPLEASGLYTPVTGEWFRKENITPDEEGEYYLKRLDMDLIRYTLSPDNQTLTAYYTTPLYLSREEREKVLPYLKNEPKIYSWNKSLFK